MKSGKMVPDLIAISEIRSYIAHLTGVLVSKQAAEQWLKSGEIETVLPPNTDRRKKYTTKREVLKFVRRYAEKKEPELSENLKPYSK